MPRHTPAPGAHLRALLALLLLPFALAARSARADHAAMAEVGINSHILRADTYSHAEAVATCDEIIASGIKSVRLSFEWNLLQPEADTPLPPPPPSPLASPSPERLVFERLEYVIGRLRAPSLGDRKVEILMQLHYGADWCSTAPATLTSGRAFYPPTPVDGLNAWASYVTFLATQYDGKIAHWEVWNEPDSNVFLRINPGAGYTDRVDAYHQLLTRAYNALKGVNLANQVLLGGLVMPKENPQATNPEAPYMQVDFLDQLLARPGAKTKFDIMNYHAYGDAVSQREKYLAVQTVLAKHGIQDRKIWLTETGYSTAGNTALEAMKADRIAQHWLNHMSYPNIEKMFWYVDRNVVSKATNPDEKAIEENFGLRSEATRAPLLPWFHYQALDGASVDFERQDQYPSVVQTQNAVYYSGSGIAAGTATTNPPSYPKVIPTTGLMYFHVSDNWLHDANGGLDDTVYVDFEYQNTNTSAGIRLDYDPKGPAASASLPILQRNTSGNWTPHTFVIPNAGFTNSLANGADFAIYAGVYAPLPIRNVVVRRRTDAARIKFGPVDRGFLMERSHSDVSSEANYNPALTYNGEPCRQIASNKFMILRVSDAFVRTGDTRVQVKIRFWNDQVGFLHIQYNAADGNTAKSTTSLNGINKTSLPYGWTAETITLEDADFRNAGSYGSTDFRIPSGGVTQYISSVEVTPLPLLSSEDFQDGNSTGWTTTGGSWSVVNTNGNFALRQSAATGETIAVTGVNTWNDYDYSADLTLHHNSAAGILARYTDANNYYVFAISTGLDRFYIKKRVAGLTSSLVDLPRVFDIGVAYRLRLVLNGPWITAFIGSEQVARFYDTSLATGRVGARAVDGIYSVDNVAVY